MDRIKKLMKEAEREYIRRKLNRPGYDFSGFSDAVLKGIIEDRYTEEELETLLKRVRFFSSNEEYQNELKERPELFETAELVIIDDVTEDS